MMRQLRLAEVLPKTSATRHTITAIQLFRRKTMKFLNHRRKRRGSPTRSRRTMRNQMIVIRKNRPSLQFPTKLFHELKQSSLKPILQLISAEKITLVSCTSGNKIDTRFLQPMRRSMRPVMSPLRNALFWFQRVHPVNYQPENSQQELRSHQKKSNRHPASRLASHESGSKATAVQEPKLTGEATWTAAALLPLYGGAARCRHSGTKIPHPISVQKPPSTHQSPYLNFPQIFSITPSITGSCFFNSARTNG